MEILLGCFKRRFTRYFLFILGFQLHISEHHECSGEIGGVGASGTAEL